MKKTKEEIKKIIIDSVEEARACFDTEEEFISYLNKPVEHDFAALRNKEWEEIILTVVNNSTWGSHRTGGPVWVMDFSYENVKSLLPNNPWVPYFSKDKYNESIMMMIDYAKEFIIATCVNNVLIVYPNDDKFVKRPKMTFITNYRILDFIDFQVYPPNMLALTKRWNCGNYSLEKRASHDLLFGAEIDRLPKGEYTVCVDDLPKEPMIDFGDDNEYWYYPLYGIDKGQMGPCVQIPKSSQVKDYLPMYIYDVMEYMRLEGLNIAMRHEFRYTKHADTSERVALLKKSGIKNAYGIVPVNRVDKIKMVYQTLELKMPEITEEHWFKQFPKKIKWEEL
ncbi:MAG: hypothetical protein IJE43_20255 [Alphaproteobacteria bacterium]|nr:hypothetical protein [Alphaproteobacteria bacterium]